MESDKRPHYPCDFCEDELDLIENLVRGNTRTNEDSLSNRSRRNDCGCNDNCDRDNCNSEDENAASRDCMCRCEHSNSMSDRCSECEMPSFNTNTALAIVYSPDHSFNDMYDAEEGLCEGTLFRRLNKPFEGATVRGGGR